MKVCAVAVDAATYAIDRLYDYIAPRAGVPEIGCRVLVPFGRGNKRLEAVVMAVREGTGEGLKPVLEVLDAEPVLTAAQLKLAVWLRERLFCTFFDCVRTILPAGLWFRRRERFSLGACDLSAWQARADEAGEVLRLFGEGVNTLTLPELEAALPGKSARPLLDRLCAEGVLVYEPGIAPNARDKTETMLRLALDPETAVRCCARGSAVRRDVVSLLSDGGAMSRRELAYMTGASTSVLNGMVTRGILEKEEAEVFRTPDFSDIPQGPPVELSAAQQAVFEGLSGLLHQPEAAAALLYGVTGSGKTQVYLKLIAETLALGRAAIVLVPEIGLTPQVIRHFVGQFGDQVAVLHSALSTGERYDSWKRIKSGACTVVVGTRSAVFAPVADLGLLIIDEEQDGAYRSEQSPRYHARDVAKYLIGKSKGLLVLGSATPSVESYYAGKQGKYPIFTLSERFMGTPMPEVTVADLRGEARQGNIGSIGAVLHAALEENLAAGRQSILFLNRRGNSRTIGCPQCGWVPQCPSCTSTLTYHSVNSRAMCHYCGFSVKITGQCPECGGMHLFTETAGTQRVEEELHEKFPQARVLRMDADTTTRRGAHEKLLAAFAKGQADILLGTQMVTKGLDFENVTLVGVLDADQSLYAPSFRAKERTFSLITQVVGRAGRRFDTGRAIIQTSSPNHPVILAAARQDYGQFYESEIQARGALLAPPIAELLVLTATGEEERQVLASLLALRRRIEGLLEGQFREIRCPVLGPVPATVVRVMGRYRYYLTLRCPEGKARRQLVSGVLCEFARDKQNRGVSLFADLNPDL
ncbi:MAG: primosomal protein N' [Clostridiaceae bacterium]|nr:primosomal protein N' [Clostridiaceae bacterium]